jgi:mono/diheme cytochrome c family protein
VFEKRATGYNLGVLGICVSLCMLATATLAVPKVVAPLPQASATPTTAQRALLNQYCVTCHNQQLKTAGLSLDKADLNDVAGSAEVWEKVVMKLRSGMMPPLGRPKPAADAIHSMVSLLETSLDKAASAKPNPGRASLHRLNRTEYGNAVRDLLDLEVDVKELLPPDDESNGFDNIADVLKVSPSLLEQYLGASRKISALAVGDPAITPLKTIYRVPPDRSQEGHIEGLPLGTRGGTLIRENFPLDAEYQVDIVLLRNVLGYMKGLEWPHQIEINVDGERVFLAAVGGDDDNRASDANFAAAADMIDERLRARIPVKAGRHEIGVTFLRKNSSETAEPLELHSYDHDLQNMNGIPLVDHVDITGPIQGTSSGDTPSRRRIFTCKPASAAEETPCARKILSTLARRAYRGTVAASDLDALMGFYETARKKRGFEAGVQNALHVMLATPKFLFRSEADPANVTSGQIYKVDDFALASRLSFFLWSSIPDEELLALAEQTKLKDPAVLNAQIKRMLADRKSEALTKNFAGQWLFLRNLQSSRPDNKTFPDFDDNLRQAFRKETEMFVDSIVREDRNVIDLLTADFTYVNERLARHYGIPNVYGSHFRRAQLPDVNRRGLLGQGSILTVTSYPNRTSPVLRGKWILENIMGTPPPPPPATVPPFPENEEGGKQRAIREILEEHRRNPACATCHAVMDPLGFSLENFDATGEWRKKDKSGPIDPSGVLADGTRVDGPVALRQALLKQPERFVDTMTEKLMIYALGRGLEYYDMPVVRGIVRDAAKQDYKFSALVFNIVKSTPFQMKKAQ